MHGNEEKNKAAEVGGPLCRISCQLRRPHIQPLLSQSLVPSVKLHLLDLDVLLFVPSHRLASPRPPPPPDCNRSSSLLPLSMQALLHAVHSLSAIRKCHRLLFFQKDRKLNGTEKN